MSLMRSSDPETQEAGFAVLEERAAAELDRLVAENETETDHGLRCWLLELIGDARSERAFPVLESAPRGDDVSLRMWAIHGLRQLDTKGARRLLWEAETFEFTTPTETEDFRRMLHDPSRT